MGKITWDTDCDAPCIGRIVAEDGRDMLIQTDWDYPSVAQTFGWTLAHVQRCDECGGAAIGPNVLHCQVCDHASETAVCQHSHTDGTVECPECHCTPGEFISAAAEWLTDNDGAEADDPGYFSEGE